MFYNAWTLASKDLRMYFRDRSGLVTSLLVPIAMVTVFGWIMAYAFGGGSGLPKIKLWIVDSDQSTRSAAFEKTLRQSSLLDCLPRAGEPPITFDRLKQMIADGDASHGLVIPAGFGQSDSAQTPPDIQLLRDPGREMEDRILQLALVQSLISTSDMTTWKQSLERWIKTEGASDQELKRFGEVFDIVQHTISDGINQLNQADSSDSNQSDPPTQSGSTQPSSATAQTSASEKPEVKHDSSGVDSSGLDSKGLESMLSMLDKVLPVERVDMAPPARPKRVTYQQAQSVSGVTVMMMMFSLTGAGALLLGERERGTLRRLLALPIERESILLGKFLFVAIAGLLQMGVLMIYGELMFKVGLFRDPLTLAVLVISWVATAGSFGMAIATLSTSSKQADSLATIMILVMAALGGCWFPTQLMSLPWPLEIASKSTLTYWAMEGFQGLLWNGLSWHEPKMLRALALQWLWAAVLSGLSVYGFRKNYLRVR